MEGRGSGQDREALCSPGNRFRWDEHNGALRAPCPWKALPQLRGASSRAWAACAPQGLLGCGQVTSCPAGLPERISKPVLMAVTPRFLWTGRHGPAMCPQEGIHLAHSRGGEVFPGNPYVSRVWGLNEGPELPSRPFCFLRKALLCVYTALQNTPHIVRWAFLLVQLLWAPRAALVEPPGLPVGDTWPHRWLPPCRELVACDPEYRHNQGLAHVGTQPRHRELPAWSWEPGCGMALDGGFEELWPGCSPGLAEWGACPSVSHALAKTPG